MNVNKITITDAEEYEKYHHTQPYKTPPHGSQEPSVDLLEFETQLCVTFEATDERYIDLEQVASDGIERAHLTNVYAKETSVIWYDSGSFHINVWDHTIDAYPKFKQVFTQFNSQAAKEGNDLLLDGEKVMGVSSFDTDAWGAAGQLSPSTIPLNDYMNLPDSKFDGKSVDSAEERLGCIADHVPFDPTINDVEQALENIFQPL